MIFINKKLFLITSLILFKFVQPTPYKAPKTAPCFKQGSPKKKIKESYPNGDVQITYKEGYSIKADKLSNNYKTIYIGLTSDEPANARILCGFAPHKKTPTLTQSIDWSKMPITQSLAILKKNS